jgi:hypothetical protein
MEAEIARRRPHVVFHLAAYKHVDWAETYPEEFVDTNLHGSWNVLRAAEGRGVETVVVASTDKAALAASFYGRTKRLMEQLTAVRRAARGPAAHRRPARQRPRQRGQRLRAVRPPGARRPAAHHHRPHDAALLDHAAARRGARGPRGARGRRGGGPGHGGGSRAAQRGELGARIWSQVGPPGPQRTDLLGIRRGETLTEVLVGEGEELGPERRHGIAAITGDVPTGGAAWVSERLPDRAPREDARAVWLEAMRRPGLVTAPAAG